MSENYFKCECCGQVFLNESSMSINNKNRCIHCYDFTRQQDIEIFTLKTWLKTKERRIDRIRGSFLTDISNLEAKLAEKSKWLSLTDKHIKKLKQQLAEKEKTITTLIEDSKASKELLRKQLAEKEKEIISL